MDRVQQSVERTTFRLVSAKQNIERITQTYGRNRTYVLFGKDKEMKEIIEGILKELRVKYITENDLEKIESTNVVIY
jgi:predicted DNA-binding protein